MTNAISTLLVGSKVVLLTDCEPSLLFRLHRKFYRIFIVVSADTWGVAHPMNPAAEEI